MSWVLLRQNVTDPTQDIQGNQAGYPQSRIKSRLAYVAQRIPEDFEWGVTLALDSEERRKLRGYDLDRGPRDESANRRSWDEFNQPTEPQCSKEKNHDTLGKKSHFSDEEGQLLCGLRIRSQEWPRFEGQSRRRGNPVGCWKELRLPITTRLQLDLR